MPHVASAMILSWQQPTNTCTIPVTLLLQLVFNLYFVVVVMSVFSDDNINNQNNFSAELNVDNNAEIDQELQNFFMIEKQKAQINAQIHEFNDHCWEKCLVDKPKNKLDNKTETCLNNCVNRFIDVSLLITNRFAMSLQKGAKM